MVRKLDRRTLLRGLAGTALALPLLEIMLDDNGEALANGDPLPRRYLVTFGAFSLVTDTEKSPDGFIPDIIGPGYEQKDGIKPLFDHGVNDVVSIVSGLEVGLVVKPAIPPPGGLNFFHRKTPAWFCGESVYGGTDKQPYPAHYPSSDQIVAAALADPTLLFPKGLQYRVQVKHYYTGEAWPDEGQMSWGDDGAGGIIGIDPQFSPKAAFDSLFTAFTPTDPAEAKAKAFELAKRGSILDLIDRRGSGLLARLSASDRHKVEQHLTHVRDLELLIKAEDTPMTGECKLLPDPGADPPIGSDNTSGFQNGAYVNEGYSDEHARAQVFTKLMHMAFTCDLARAATLQYSHVASQMNVNAVTNVLQKMHSFHHNGGTIANLNKIIAWHMGHFGELVSLLKNTPEGAGTLLDNCAVAFMNEGGRGTPTSTDGSHSGLDIAFLFAGGAGGLRRGEHVRVMGAGYHPANYLISMMNAVGVPATQLGEISGAIPQMFV